MADYHRTSMLELDDDVHRLLPRDILKDIGIIDAAEPQLLDVVEVLAARLAGVLGGTATMASCHHPQVTNGTRRLDAMDVLAGGGNMRRVAALPFLAAPPAAVPWQALETLRNGMVLHPEAALPGFATATARPLAGRVEAATVRRRGGTGVFLPRTEAARRTAKAASPPSNDVKPMRKNRAQKKQRRGEQAAMTMVRKQQAMAAQMEQRYLDVHALPELALPQ